MARCFCARPRSVRWVCLAGVAVRAADPGQGVSAVCLLVQLCRRLLLCVMVSAASVVHDVAREVQSSCTPRGLFVLDVVRARRSSNLLVGAAARRPLSRRDGVRT